MEQGNPSEKNLQEKSPDKKKKSIIILAIIAIILFLILIITTTGVLKPHRTRIVQRISISKKFRL